ncbi:hypothetical protein ZOSMA_89G01230 [Zostera marina]|uniref:HMA domain-containing protein n=1 Tax=Zostera marina TaxID=29655 RepID=A0A0K9NMH5_ZOSMR|nr:hypothetical protein ZOSMA_89G01230 [Zostera marina]
MKKGMKMHGFLCQSHASTAVCIPGDSRSVIVPRRPDRTLIMDRHYLPETTLVDFKYSRLREHRREKGSSITIPRVEKIKQEVVIGSSTLSKPVVNPPASSLVPTYGDIFQVVVMRVSIHCQGCAGKVKKHIAKMEGVTSFSIDLESKRVTVMGHISPVGVLESISKVKKAEFWQGK